MIFSDDRATTHRCPLTLTARHARPVGACRHRRLIVSELSQLSPQPLWDIFAKICSIPHPSYHEEALAHILTGPKKEPARRARSGRQYPAAQAGHQRHGKPQACRAAGAPDMVPQRITTPCTTSPGSDPALYRRRVGESARHHAGRADNGIMASATAVLADDSVEHGPLEVLLTMTEEAGMDGAFAAAELAAGGHPDQYRFRRGR